MSAMDRVEVKTEAPMSTEEEDEYGQSSTVLRHSLSADDSCGSDSGSQSHDEDAGTSSGSNMVESAATRLHTARYTQNAFYYDPCADWPIRSCWINIRLGLKENVMTLC